MLFSTRPKEDRKDLYDREKEIEMIKDSIFRGEWTAVLGIRRIGKSSVVNVSVKESGSIPIYVNLTRLNTTKKKQYDKASFLSLLLESTNLTIRNYTFLGKISRIISNIVGLEEVDFSSLKVKGKLKKIDTKDLSYLFLELDRLAKDNRKKVTIVLDEAQELSKIAGINFPSLFHDIYEECNNTVVIFTGSMIRILESTLKDIEYQEPFFGRYIRKITLERFTKDQSEDFLTKGFEEEGISVDKQIIDEAVQKLDGIPGWLTIFGSEYSFAVKHGQKPRIDDIVSKAEEEAKSEAKNFLENSQSPLRYSAIILALDRLGGTGELKEIKKVSSTILDEEIPEPRVYELLNRLVDYTLVEKIDDKYSLPTDEPNRKGIVKSAEEIFKSETQRD
ncbi:AAA family ATPase [Acidianus manzaensis]|uniref:ATPase n=1 Tax=Acidianus manzaensis TaxID=282676 RepID=A0A1W6K373_9CREN|nr:ATP-binding protein [Acidianus manzaensis]ARM76950.1 ATPase [Acidianus manzaensis]